MSLPAGMRNNNPGNIKYVGQAGTHPSVNTDQGDPQAVYASPEAGMAAMYGLLGKKYRGGKITPRMMIAGQGGWTPGNTAAAGNVARTMGIGIDDDIRFTDPASAAKFMRALMLQEHGKASLAYTDQQIASAIGSGGVYDTGQAAAQAPYEQPTGPKGQEHYAQPFAPPDGPKGQEAWAPPASGPANIAVAGGQTDASVSPYSLTARDGKKDTGLAAMAKMAMGAPGKPWQLPQIDPTPGAARIDQPAMPTLDPQQTEARRAQLAQLLARLNQGSLV